MKLYQTKITNKAHEYFGKYATYTKSKKHGVVLQGVYDTKAEADKEVLIDQVITSYREAEEAYEKLVKKYPDEFLPRHERPTGEKCSFGDLLA